MVVESLTTDEYHIICFTNLSQFRTISISTSTTVNLVAIIACSSDYPLEGPIEIAYTPNVDSHIPAWQTSEGVNGAVMEDGWTRYFILFLHQRYVLMIVISPQASGLTTCSMG
jgi:hypothetical protein